MLTIATIVIILVVHTDLLGVISIQQNLGINKQSHAAYSRKLPGPLDSLFVYRSGSKLKIHEINSKQF
jgi:hypothetical protein